MNHREYILQTQICNYLHLQYPEILFLSDTIAAVKLKPQQAIRNKSIQKHGFKTPDLLILEPRGKYHGLFIELKTETPYKLNGEIKASQNDHLKKQQESMNKLNEKGFFAVFSWGFDMTKEIIDNYLNEKL